MAGVSSRGVPRIPHPMRILLAADPIVAVPPTGYGGIERIVDALAGELRARGHTVALMAKAGSTCTVDARFAWPGASVNGRLDTLRNALALRQAVRRFRPDVVHSFARLAYLLPVLPSVTPKIMSYQRHTGARAIRPALRLARRGTLRFTGCSEFICTQGRAAGGDWRSILNFVDSRKFDFVAAVPADAPLVFLSRIESIKGPDIAIAIARRIGRRLVLAGNRASEGPEARFFEERVAPQLGTNGIEWIGEVDDPVKNRLLGQAAALLLPIRWEEPFGIVLAEALACGTPVLTCPRGATPEIVEPGRTGFFFETVEEGADAVHRIAELDRRACREAATIRFSLDSCVTQYLALYGESIDAS